MAHPLAAKITSPSDPTLTEYITKYGRGCLGASNSYLLRSPKNWTNPWWLQREYHRLDAGVYEQQTEILHKLCSYNPQFALHISVEDRKLIAYTPDRAYGEADRQVHITLGKFIAKYYSHIGDNEVRAIVADHEAELDSSFEELTGQAITDVYLSGATGACMSKSAEDFSANGGHHPTEVYHAPGISMAVVRDSEGKVTGRCLLVKLSDTDKRYIRVYNSDALKRKLTRAGYKPGGWNGVKFNTVVLDDKGDYARVAIPYLDCHGSTGGPEGSTVALLDGVLTGVSPAIAKALQNTGVAHVTYCSTNTAGHTTLAKSSSESFKQTCALTGRVLDTTIEEMEEWWDGEKPVLVCKEAAVDGISAYTYPPNGGPRRGPYLMSKDTPTFTAGYQNLIDNELNRNILDFVKLDIEWYPDEQEWISSRYGTVRTSSNRVVRAIDTVKYASDTAWVTYHKAEQVKLGKKLHSLKRGEPLYALEGTKTVRTINGRTVVPALYDVAQTFNGDWDFKRNLSAANFMGDIHYAKKGEAVITQELARKVVRERLQVSSYRSLYEKYCTKYLRVGQTTLHYYSGYVAWPAIWEAHKVRGGESVTADAINYWYELDMADAEAVNYNEPQRLPYEDLDAYEMGRLGQLLDEADGSGYSDKFVYLWADQVSGYTVVQGEKLIYRSYTTWTELWEVEEVRQHFTGKRIQRLWEAEQVIQHVQELELNHG